MWSTLPRVRTVGRTHKKQKFVTWLTLPLKSWVCPVDCISIPFRNGISQGKLAPEQFALRSGCCTRWQMKSNIKENSASYGRDTSTPLHCGNNSTSPTITQGKKFHYPVAPFSEERILLWLARVCSWLSRVTYPRGFIPTIAAAKL